MLEKPALARAKKAADAFYAVPEALRCPRPINGTTDFSMKWCKENGYCGCEVIEDLQERYGAALYPGNANDEQ